MHYSDILHDSVVGVSIGFQWSSIESIQFNIASNGKQKRKNWITCPISIDMLNMQSSVATSTSAILFSSIMPGLRRQLRWVMHRASKSLYPSSTLTSSVGTLYVVANVTEKHRKLRWESTCSHNVRIVANFSSIRFGPMNNIPIIFPNRKFDVKLVHGSAHGRQWR